MPKTKQPTAVSAATTTTAEGKAEAEGGGGEGEETIKQNVTLEYSLRGTVSLTCPSAAAAQH